MSSADGPELRGPESELTPQGPRQLISKGHRLSRDQDMESRVPTTDRLLMSEVWVMAVNGLTRPGLSKSGHKQTSAIAQKNSVPARNFLRLAPDLTHTISTHSRAGRGCKATGRLLSKTHGLAMQPEEQNEGQPTVPTWRGPGTMTSTCPSGVAGPSCSLHEAALHPTVMPAVINLRLQQTGLMFRKASVWLVNTV